MRTIRQSNTVYQSLGYRVTARTRSVSALDTFQKAPEAFDLVSTDVTMPSMTGVGLARNVLLVRPGIPIILCTGFSDVMNAKTIIKSKCKIFRSPIDYIAKDLNIDMEELDKAWTAANPET